MDKFKLRDTIKKTLIGALVIFIFILTLSVEVMQIAVCVLCLVALLLIISFIIGYFIVEEYKEFNKK